MLLAVGRGVLRAGPSAGFLLRAGASRPRPPPAVQLRALATTIDVQPRGVTEGEPGERPIIVPPPPPGSSSSSRVEEEEKEEAPPVSEAKGWGLFPDDIVAHLDKYVIGQEEAKKVQEACVDRNRSLTSVWSQTHDHDRPTSSFHLQPTCPSS